jgi:dTDP-glucose 4,6-dehydratase
MRYSELLGLAARNEFRLPIVNIRPFTFCGAYGSVQSPWALNNFINDVLSDRPISILGDGSAIRSYMYGADLAAWILVITLHSDDGKTYNVGNDHGFSIFEIAKKVSNFFQPSPSILLNTSLAPKVNNFSLLPDISNVKKDFGLSIYTDVDTSIKRSLEWHQENLNSKS